MIAYRMIFDKSYRIRFISAHNIKNIFDHAKRILYEQFYKLWYLLNLPDFPRSDMKNIMPYLRKHHPAYKNIK